MRNNLVAVKRMNKNGVMVTKHVKADSLTSGNAAGIAAPTLAQQKKPEVFQSAHIASNDDPRVMNGEVIDRVVVGDVLYSRSRDGVTPREFRSVRVQLSRPLQEGEDERLASMVGYAFKLAMRPNSGYGNNVEVVSKDTPYSVILEADTYYAGTSNMEYALQKFEREVATIVQEGSPVRKTNRAGPNTENTRAVNGFNDESLSFEFYYDEVDGDAGVKVAQERGIDIEAIDTVLSHDVKPLSEGML